MRGDPHWAVYGALMLATGIALLVFNRIRMQKNN
jgi:hypothetical protein